MTNRRLFSFALIAGLFHCMANGRAEVRTYHLDATVVSRGNVAAGGEVSASDLAVGDVLAVEFSYDDAVADANASTAAGEFPSAATELKVLRKAANSGTWAAVPGGSTIADGTLHTVNPGSMLINPSALAGGPVVSVTDTGGGFTSELTGFSLELLQTVSDTGAGQSLLAQTAHPLAPTGFGAATLRFGTAEVTFSVGGFAAGAHPDILPVTRFNWNGGCYASQVGGQGGSMSFTKTWNGTDYDVVMTGNLQNINSPTYGYLRKALPPGLRPKVEYVGGDTNSVVHVSGTFTSTAGEVYDVTQLGNCCDGIPGIHIRTDSGAGGIGLDYVNNGDFWLADPLDGRYDIQAEWKTDQPNPPDNWASCSGILPPLRAPKVICPGSSQTVDCGALLSVAVDAVFYDSLAVTWSLDGAPLVTNTLSGAATTATLAARFPAGSHTVGVSVDNGQFPAASCSFPVVVNPDLQAPVIQAPPVTFHVSAGTTSSAVNFNPIAVDACEGVVAVSCVPASGSVFPLGTTQVNCSTLDLAGNAASTSFTVTVAETPFLIAAHTSEPLDGVYTARRFADASVVSGVVSFTARVPQPGLFRGLPGAAQAYVLAGMPGPAGTTYNTVDLLDNRGGRSVFYARYFGGASNTGLVSLDGATQSFIIQVGDPFEGATVDGLGKPVGNASGDVIFLVYYNDYEDTALVLNRAGVNSVLLRSGDSTAIGVLSGLDYYAIDDQGNVVFTGYANNYNASGLFRLGVSGVEVLASNTTAAPVGTFSGFSEPDIAAGKIVLVAYYDDYNQSAFFEYAGGTLRRLIGAGDTFGDFNLQYPSYIRIDEQGHTILMGYGSSPQGSGNLLFSLVNGQPVKILGRGDTLGGYTVEYLDQISRLDPDGSGRVAFLFDNGQREAGVATYTPPAAAVAGNIPPLFVAGTTPSVDEDSGAQTVAAWATAIDDGNPEVTQALTFSVGLNSNPSLLSAGPAVDVNSGTLTYTPAPDAHGSASIEIILTDDNTAGGPARSVTNLLSITVNAVNDEPSFACGSNQTVAGNAGPQTVPGWATAIDDNDPEVSQGLTFQIVGNTNPGILAGIPAISPGGTLTYAPALVGCGATTLTVRLMDDGGTAFGGDDTSATCSFTITVLSPEITVHRISGVELQDNAGTVDFGQGVVGGAVTRRLLIGNACTSPLVISGATLASGAPFSVVPPVPGSVAPGGRGILTVRFSPTASGPFADTLSIASNDPDEPSFDISLVGTGFLTDAPLACNPSAATNHSAVVHSRAANDSTQGQMLAAGDVNGDEIDDWLVGLPLGDSASPARTDCGLVAVYFGGNAFGNGVRDFAGTHGAAPDVLLVGPATNAKLGVDGNLRLADLNNDLIQDIVVSSSIATTPTSPARAQGGVAYVLPGRLTWSAVIDLNVSGAATAISGANTGELITLGGALATGDFDGDGYADLALGSVNAGGPPLISRPKCGRVYLVRGRASWPTAIDLKTQANGIVYGAGNDDQLTEGGALALGDVNGDGLQDLVVGAQRADGPANARAGAGEAYVVRGRSLATALAVDLAANQQDQIILGATASDALTTGGAVAVGDLNGDGRAEIVLGASPADGPLEARVNSGEAAIVPGAAVFNPTIDLAVVSGFIPVYGANAGDLLTAGGAIRIADVTGDGAADLILGAEGGAGPSNTRTGAGEAYVINGRASWPTGIDLSSLPSDSLVIYGATANDRLTRNGAIRVGDLNSDGIGDLILGADSADGPSNARGACGEVEVVFGQSTWTLPAKDLMTTFDGTFLSLAGGTSNDELSKNNALGLGDIDGDGAIDLLVAAPGVDGPAGSVRTNAGAAYRLRGKPGTLACGGGLMLIGFRPEPPAPADIPPAAPVIEALLPSESGEATTVLWGESGRRHVLEASSDLVTWVEVGEQTPGRSSLLRLPDPGAADRTHLYYRVRRE